MSISCLFGLYCMILTQLLLITARLRVFYSLQHNEWALFLSLSTINQSKFTLHCNHASYRGRFLTNCYPLGQYCSILNHLASFTRPNSLITCSLSIILSSFHMKSIDSCIKLTLDKFDGSISIHFLSSRHSDLAIMIHLKPFPLEKRAFISSKHKSQALFLIVSLLNHSIIALHLTRASFTCLVLSTSCQLGIVILSFCLSLHHFCSKSVFSSHQNSFSSHLSCVSAQWIHWDYSQNCNYVSYRGRFLTNCYPLGQYCSISNHLGSFPRPNSLTTGSLSIILESFHMKSTDSCITSTSCQFDGSISAHFLSIRHSDFAIMINLKPLPLEKRVIIPSKHKSQAWICFVSLLNHSIIALHLSCASIRCPFPYTSCQLGIVVLSFWLISSHFLSKRVFSSHQNSFSSHLLCVSAQ